MSWVTRTVDPFSVVPARGASTKEIEHQMNRLKEEGQIEPITCVLVGSAETVAHSAESFYIVRDLVDDWIHASAQVIAARELKWPTILVTYEVTK